MCILSNANFVTSTYIHLILRICCLKLSPDSVHPLKGREQLLQFQSPTWQFALTQQFHKVTHSDLWVPLFPGHKHLVDEVANMLTIEHLNPCERGTVQLDLPGCSRKTYNRNWNPPEQCTCACVCMYLSRGGGGGGG